MDGNKGFAAAAGGDAPDKGDGFETNQPYSQTQSGEHTSN